MSHNRIRIDGPVYLTLGEGSQVTELALTPTGTDAYRAALEAWGTVMSEIERSAARQTKDAQDLIMVLRGGYEKRFIQELKRRGLVPHADARLGGQGAGQES